MCLVVIFIHLVSSFWAAAPKGPVTYAFTYAEISPSSPSLTTPPHIKAPIPASRFISQPLGPNPSFKAQIPASKLKSQAQRLNPSFKANIPGLKAQIPDLL